jgi:hypothetical protein
VGLLQLILARAVLQSGTNGFSDEADKISDILTPQSPYIPNAISSRCAYRNMPFPLPRPAPWSRLRFLPLFASTPPEQRGYVPVPQRVAASWQLATGDFPVPSTPSSQ